VSPLQSALIAQLGRSSGKAPAGTGLGDERRVMALEEYSRCFSRLLLAGAGLRVVGPVRKEFLGESGGLVLSESVLFPAFALTLVQHVQDGALRARVSTRTVQQVPTCVCTNTFQG